MYPIEITGRIISVVPSGLREEVAKRIFGWQWMAFVDTPVRRTPGYPNKCRVRRFYPPLSSRSQKTKKAWEGYFAEVPHEPAKGDEPLAYCYCSSNGPDEVPDYGGDYGDTMQAVEAVQAKHDITMQTESLPKGEWGVAFLRGDKVLSALRSSKKDHVAAIAQALLEALDAIESPSEEVPS